MHLSGPLDSSTVEPKPDPEHPFSNRDESVAHKTLLILAEPPHGE